MPTGLLQTSRKGDFERLGDGWLFQAASRSSRSATNAMASVSMQEPKPKARSTMLASPRMPPVMLNNPAWPLRKAVAYAADLGMDYGLEAVNSYENHMLDA